jgi:membrane-associated protease RseP (regulator of RpoE activity)
MNLKSFAVRFAFLATSSLVGLTHFGHLYAEEAPANDPSSPPVQVQIDAVPVQQVADLSNTQFALGALYMATNTDWIGGQVAQIDDVLRSHLGLAEGKGLVVTSLIKNGPAAKAGVQKFDVLISVGGEEIAGVEALRKSLEASADKPIALGLIRGGKNQSIEVTPHSMQTADLGVGLSVQPRYWLGVGLAAADDALRSQLGVSAGEGLVVTNVENDSAAAKEGVMVNDVLLKLDGQALTTVESLNEQLQTIADKSVRLELLRHGKPAMLTVTPKNNAVPQGAVQWLNLNNANYGNAFILDGNHYRTVGNGIFWAEPAANNYFVGVRYPEFNAYQVQLDLGQYPLLALNPYQAQPDLATRLSDLVAQIKQLEASLAAVRSAIETTTQPTQGNEQKK